LRVLAITVEMEVLLVAEKQNECVLLGPLAKP
jgi:hypothetical protein